MKKEKLMVKNKAKEKQKSTGEKKKVIYKERLKGERERDNEAETN